MTDREALPKVGDSYSDTFDHPAGGTVTITHVAVRVGPRRVAEDVTYSRSGGDEWTERQSTKTWEWMIYAAASKRRAGGED